MSSTLNEFLSQAHGYKHHALLLAHPLWKEQFFLGAKDVVTLAKEGCGIAIQETKNSDEESTWASLIRNPDVTIVDRERDLIRKNDLTKIFSTLLYAPQRGYKKLILIEKCDRLNAHAANALLKSIEEPMVPALFVLTTARFQDVLPTLASRCQKVQLRMEPHQQQEILRHVEERRKSAQEIITWLKKHRPAKRNNALRAPWQGDSLSSPLSVTSAAQDLSAALHLAEKLSEEWSSSELWDVWSMVLAEQMKDHEEQSPLWRNLMADLQTWMANDALHPNSQLWCCRLLLKAL